MRGRVPCGGYRTEVEHWRGYCKCTAQGLRLELGCRVQPEPSCSSCRGRTSSDHVAHDSAKKIEKDASAEAYGYSRGTVGAYS